MTLEKRRIGTTDIEVTSLGFGGAPIGAANLTIEESSRIVQRAYDGGVRYFDTAPLYGEGRSERRMGAGLAQLPRDEIILSTKVGRLLVPATDSGESTFGEFEIDYDYSYDAARRSLEASFERLGLDRVDILLCHDIDVWTHGDAQPGIFDTAVNGILPALNDLREQGVVRAIGLGVNEAEVCSQIMDRFDVDCFLLAGRFTLLEQAPLDTLLPKCLDQNVSIIIGGPYNSGLLARAERDQATYDYKPVDDERWARAQAIREVCDAHQVDIRAAALQYPLRHGAVASVIPGSANMQELESNLALIDMSLPDTLWTDLEDAGLAKSLA
ncbi:MAG: aldo/keto reductase [Chloroflexota bacterium]